jgi:hypothetical protein
MKYKKYPKKADTPNRMARKHERNKVFEYNRKAQKLQRKREKIESFNNA